MSKCNGARMVVFNIIQDLKRDFIMTNDLARILEYLQKYRGLDCEKVPDNATPKEDAMLAARGDG